MNLIENQEIKDIIERLKDGMLNFIDEEEYYSPENVDVCINILKNHLNQISNATNKEESMQIVEKTVLSLNELNVECDDCLIETDQREDICEIIIMASHLKGYNEMKEDITEEWREW